MLALDVRQAGRRANPTMTIGDSEIREDAQRQTPQVASRKPATGAYDRRTRRISGRFIVGMSIPLAFAGAVASLE